MTTVEPSQQSAAKVAGFLYLVTMATSIFAYAFVRGRLIVARDAVQTARNIIASEGLFRVGIVVDLLTIVGVIVLFWGLYVALKPVNPRIALLAAFFRLAENIVIAASVMVNFAVLALLTRADYMSVFGLQQSSALAYALIRVLDSGFKIGFVFLGIGSTLFSWLWLKSGYVPRAIALWGIFSSSLLTLGTLAGMLYPALGAVVGLFYMVPMFFYEVGLGLWLLIKGLKAS